MTAISSSGSWSRERILWIQVGAFLHHATLQAETIDAVRIHLYNPRHLKMVQINAFRGGLRVAYWRLRIDWSRHALLMGTHKNVNSRDFSSNQEAYGVTEFINMLEEHFVAETSDTRGWGFESSIEFRDACARLGVSAGEPVRDHPDLKRYAVLAVPGIEEMTIEAGGID